MSWTSRKSKALVDAYASGRAITGRNRILGPAMRLQIIEMLDYPRMLLVANMDYEECPQNQYFNSRHQSCQWCPQGEECRWLNLNDEFTLLAQQSTSKLLDSLLFCIDYVDAQSLHANHDVRRCACESCEWVRNARKLVRDYERTDLA